MTTPWSPEEDPPPRPLRAVETWEEHANDWGRRVTAAAVVARANAVARAEHQAYVAELERELERLEIIAGIARVRRAMRWDAPVVPEDDPRDSLEDGGTGRHSQEPPPASSTDDVLVRDLTATIKPGGSVPGIGAIKARYKIGSERAGRLQDAARKALGDDATTEQ